MQSHRILSYRLNRQRCQTVITLLLTRQFLFTATKTRYTKHRRHLILSSIDPVRYQYQIRNNTSWQRIRLPFLHPIAIPLYHFDTYWGGLVFHLRKTYQFFHSGTQAQLPFLKLRRRKCRIESKRRFLLQHILDSSS